jgi:tyrosinase
MPRDEEKMFEIPERTFAFSTFAAQLEAVRDRIRLRWPPPIFMTYPRKSQAQMTSQERERFLCAFSMVISNPAPYGWLGPFVDIHDMDISVGMHYQHGTQRFLPWHRIYLVLLERQLRSVHPDVYIPYWDWTVDRALPSWLAAYTPTVTTPAQGAITVTRSPGDPAFLPTAGEINGVKAINNFANFTFQLESYHNSVHVWVGGTMGVIPTAPCDPLFFMHHANIDRIWSQWQAANPGKNPDLPGPSPGPNSPIMDPWPYTEADTRTTVGLGYTYA